MIYFTADHHFGHEKIIKLCKRPFKDLAEMESALIDNWNSIIKPNDDVWHLGDLTYKGEVSVLKQRLDSLHGRIHLIKGNHDFKTLKYKERFSSIVDYAELKIQDQNFVLFHYPISSWNKMRHGSIHLHGHCHGSFVPIGRMLDVGVDCHDFKPLSVNDVLNKTKDKKIEIVDHHK